MTSDSEGEGNVGSTETAFACDETVAGLPPLHRAVMEDNWHDILRQLETTADIDAVDAEGKTALHRSVEYGFCHTVRKLLRTAANVEAVDAEGKTALHRSVEYGFYDIVRELLEWDAEPDVLDKNGLSPLDIAITKGRETFYAILSGDQVLFNGDGESPIHIAGTCQELRIARLLRFVVRRNLKQSEVPPTLFTLAVSSWRRILSERSTAQILGGIDALTLPNELKYLLILEVIDDFMDFADFPPRGFRRMAWRELTSRRENFLGW